MPKIEFEDFLPDTPSSTSKRVSAFLAPPRPDEIDEAVRQLPPLPALLQQLLRELRSAEANIAKLEEGISSDPGLTTRVLKMANSPFYMRAVEVVDVQRAIMTLGLRTVSNLVLAAGLRKSMRAGGSIPSFSRDGIFLHSLASGICCARLGQTIPSLNEVKEELFVGGLLHDIGRLVLTPFYRQRRREFEIISEIELTVAAENQLLETDHTRVGTRVLESWGLPAELEAPITRHHQTPERLRTDAQWTTLAVVVVDEYLNLRGFARNGPSGSDRRLDEAIEALDADRDAVVDRLEDFEDEVRSITGAFA
jgi:HD-like signal output (HDOD) protein